MPLFSKKKFKENEEKKLSIDEAVIHDSKETNPLENDINLDEKDFSQLDDYFENNEFKETEENKTTETEIEKNPEEIEIKESNSEDELPDLEEIPEKKVEDVDLKVGLKLPEENYEEELKKTLEEKNDVEEDTVEEKEEEKIEKNNSVIFIKNNHTFIELEELQKIHFFADNIIKIEKKADEKFEKINLQSEEENKIVEQLKKIVENTSKNITKIEKILFSKGE